MDANKTTPRNDTNDDAATKAGTETAAVEQHVIGLARDLLRLANAAIPSDDKSPEKIRDAQQKYCEFAASNGWVISQCLLEALNRRDVEIASLRKEG